jgi:hypothetical protein
MLAQAQHYGLLIVSGWPGGPVGSLVLVSGQALQSRLIGSQERKGRHVPSSAISRGWHGHQGGTLPSSAISRGWHGHQGGTLPRPRRWRPAQIHAAPPTKERRHPTVMRPPTSEIPPVYGGAWLRCAYQRWLPWPTVAWPPAAQILPCGDAWLHASQRRRLACLGAARRRREDHG